MAKLAILEFLGHLDLFGLINTELYSLVLCVLTLFFFPWNIHVVHPGLPSLLVTLIANFTSPFLFLLENAEIREY